MANTLQMDLKDFQQLLAEFSQIPKAQPAPVTYLEIARYPYSRFEEVCSRILAFYLQPENEHGLGNILLISLFEVLREKQYQPEAVEQVVKNVRKVSVRTEEYAEGKRIDIYVEGDDFSMAIENKISADIYNPLDVYSRYIQEIAKVNQFLIVLAPYESGVSPEKDFGFIGITYQQLFTRLKANIGQVYQGANSRHLTFLFDFIQTLENMSQTTSLTQELKKFFFENTKEAEEFVRQFQAHQGNVRALQIDKMKILIDVIRKRTSPDWWLYQGWDLGFNGFGLAPSGIGIESNFEVKDGNPLGSFRIYITTWNLRDWQPYDSFLKGKFPGCLIDQMSGNRYYLHLPPIDGSNESEIIEKLAECYFLLRDYTEELKAKR